MPEPLRILRPTYGKFDAVEILVEGKPHKLDGSKLDPKARQQDSSEATALSGRLQ
ncbi:hypothetical protein OG230_36005 [Streptomyces sp. NBC_00234]|uniref:hypothetical protein n=1 Tax=Streptomyces sp. NBC_00234 TaxID=2903638 RepID=UPI002E2B6188|nr:hypothetical protein [Streptomyces sp. NBC_00234]